jgi:hypothetical protein
MNSSTLLALLQLVTSVLVGAQHNANLSPVATRQVIAVSSQSIQLVAQVERMQGLRYAIPQEDGIYPNVKDLYNTVYLDRSGAYVPLGGTVNLVSQDTSFGDLSGDGVDDAAVVVSRKDPSGVAQFDLAAMINQGGMLFNIADISLGSIDPVVTHTINEQGEVVIKTSTGLVSKYYLLGDELIKE